MSIFFYISKTNSNHKNNKWYICIFWIIKKIDPRVNNNKNIFKNKKETNKNEKSFFITVKIVVQREIWNQENAENETCPYFKNRYVEPNTQDANRGRTTYGNNKKGRDNHNENENNPTCGNTFFTIIIGIG